MPLVSLFLLCCFYSESYEPHLRRNEWSHIRRILQNKETPPEIRQKTQQILYKKYENLAERMALQFKQIHAYKCTYIMQRDLFLYAKMGLCKAIKNYKPSYCFSPYVKIYIQGELFRSLTDLLPLQFITPKTSIGYITPPEGGYNTVRPSLMRKSVNMVVGIKDSYIAKIQTNERTKEINWKYIDYNKLYYPSTVREYSYQSEWEGNQFTPFQKRVLYIKYHYLLRGIKITNKKLSEYMGCSEEKIRYNIKRIITEQRSNE
jgi:hypothetical protein